MSRVNFSSQILDLLDQPCLDGEAPKDGETDKRKPVTLSGIATTALTMPFADEQDLTAAKKLERFRIALKVAKGGDVDLKAEEIATIKELIGKAYPPLVVGRAYDLLDPAPRQAKGK